MDSIQSHVEQEASFCSSVLFLVYIFNLFPKKTLIKSIGCHLTLRVYNYDHIVPPTCLSQLEY